MNDPKKQSRLAAEAAFQESLEQLRELIEGEKAQSENSTPPSTNSPSEVEENQEDQKSE